ncbi:MAG TPA: hypothetical protein P5246_03935 [Candidatus Omnitrophota bacterium]|nr:hypothetical protein [Candidatus Omnitrophota bacterium]
MNTVFDQDDIRAVLPQKPPFLFIDSIVDFVPGKGLTAVRNVTTNDPYLVRQPDGSVMFPPTLMIEAAAQAASFFVYRTLIERGDPERRTIVLGKIKCDINFPAEVGDVLRMEVLQGRVMASGGYADIEMTRGQNEKLGQAQVFYSFLRQDA